MSNEDLGGWGMTQIRYQIMTDADGVKWCVPTHVDGEPCEYLRKFDPSEEMGEFDKIEPLE